MNQALLRYPRFVSPEAGERAGKTTAINAIGAWSRAWRPGTCSGPRRLSPADARQGPPSVAAQLHAAVTQWLPQGVPA